MPPASPVPGWCSGEVCTLSMATRRGRAVLPGRRSRAWPGNGRGDDCASRDDVLAHVERSSSLRGGRRACRPRPTTEHRPSISVRRAPAALPKRDQVRGSARRGAAGGLRVPAAGRRHAPSVAWPAAATVIRRRPCRRTVPPRRNRHARDHQPQPAAPHGPLDRRRPRRRAAPRRRPRRRRPRLRRRALDRRGAAGPAADGPARRRGSSASRSTRRGSRPRGRTSATGLDFRHGGFEVPLPGSGRPVLIRAANVLRQYDEDEVAAVWARLCARLAPGGLLVEGTCDEIGRRHVWVALGPEGPRTVTFADPARLPGPPLRPGRTPARRR